VLRGYAETMYRAKSWSKPRRACARIEATSLGLDIRYVVTSLAAGSAEHVGGAFVSTMSDHFLRR
jgi:Transposase DDE domain group 1